MIKRKDFITGNFKKRALKREGHPIAKFLKEKYAYAFKAMEIAKAVKMTNAGVRSMLRKLVIKKLVIHKVPYFAWKK